MKISFRCPSCDKEFSVAEELAGRKAKCAACGSMMQVPAAAADYEGVKEEAADYVVEDEEQARDDTPLPRLKKRKRPAVDEDEEEDADRPIRRPKRLKKKKSKSHAGLIIGLVGGLLALLLLGGGGAGLWWYLSSGLPSEVKYLPDNFTQIGIIKWDAFSKSDFYQELKKAVPELQKDDNVGGISSDNIALVVAGGDGRESITVIRTKTPVAAADIVAKKKGVTYKEVQVGDYTMHQGPLDSFSVVEKKVVVFGLTEAVRKSLNRNKKPEMTEIMKKALKKTDFFKPVVLVMDPKGLTSAMPGGMPTGPVQLPQALKDSGGIILHIDFKAGIQIDGIFLCKDATQAEESKKEIEKALAQLKSGPAAMAISLMFGNITDILNAIKIETKGSTLLAHADLKNEQVAGILKKIAALGAQAQQNFQNQLPQQGNFAPGQNPPFPGQP